MNGAETTVYFHGMPGSPRELELFGGPIPAGWVVPDRALLRHALHADDHFDGLAGIVADVAEAGPVRLVGFSLGAFAALSAAVRLPHARLRLDLVAPAGPLGDGAVRRRMAGGALFALAAEAPRLFAAAAHAQTLAARIAPGALARRLLTSAGGEDRALARDPGFRAAMAANLRAGLAAGNRTYRREIAGYVGPWGNLLSCLRHPVAIWQGEADSWVPPEMAEALAAALGPRTALHRLPGLGHYSCLRAYLAERAREQAAAPAAPRAIGIAAAG